MDPDELEEYLATLSPEMQEQFLYEMNFGQANQMPYSFGGAFAPSLSPQSYDLSMMNQLPPDIEYGEVQPFGLDELSTAQNIMQDTGALTLDPAIAAYAGLGAFAPGAFQPQTIPIGEPLDLEGSRYIQAMAQSKGGYEAYLAENILNGMTPGAAVADMWATIAAGASPEANEAQVAERNALIASLPPNVSTDPQVGAQQISLGGDFSTPEGQAASSDVATINQVAADLFEKKVSDPTVGYTDQATGLQYAGSYQQPNELMEKFDAYGLPYPTETYLDPKYLAQAPAESQQMRDAYSQAGQQAVGLAGAVRDQTQSNLDLLTKAWQESMPGQLQSAAAQPGAAPKLSDFTQPTLSPEANADVMAEYRKAYEDWEAGGQQPAPDLRDFYEGKPLPRFAAAADNLGDWQKAYEDWQAETEGAANRGTGAPYVVSRDGQVLDTYDFGEHPEYDTEQGRGGIAALMGVVGQLGKFGGGAGGGVQVGQMTPGFLSQYQNSVADTEQQWRDAQFWQEEMDQRLYPGELESQSVGTALAMQEMGRTPLNDALMQRTIQRQSMMPYNYPTYMGY